MPDTPPDSQTPGPDTDRPEWMRKHLWQIQPVRDLLVLAAVFGIVWVGYKASIVTVPLLLAVALAYLFEPVVRWLGGMQIGRKFAAFGLIIVTAVALVGPVSIGATVGVVQGLELINRIAERTEDVIVSVEDPGNQRKLEAIPEGPWRDVRDAIIELGDDENAERSQLAARAAMALAWARDNAQAIAERAASFGAGAIDVVATTVGGLVSLAFGGFLTAFFFFFVSTTWPSVVQTRDKFIPERSKTFVHRLLGKFDNVIAGFIRGRLTIAVIQSIVFTLGYWLIGVPLPMILGPVVAFLSIVPYLAVVGIPVSIILLYLEPNGGFRDAWWWTLGAPLIFYNVGQWLDDYVWTPTIQGKEVGLGTATILFATFAGASFMGVYGLLLAIPLAACIKILFNELVMPAITKWARGERADFLPRTEDVQ